MVSRRSGSSCNKCRPSLFIEHVWHRLSDSCAIKERMFRASVINLIVSHNNQHIPNNGQHILYRVLGSFNATVYVRCCDLIFFIGGFVVSLRCWFVATSLVKAYVIIMSQLQIYLSHIPRSSHKNTPRSPKYAVLREESSWKRFHMAGVDQLAPLFSIFVHPHSDYNYYMKAVACFLSIGTAVWMDFEYSQIRLMSGTEYFHRGPACESDWSTFANTCNFSSENRRSLERRIGFRNLMIGIDQHSVALLLSQVQKSSNSNNNNNTHCLSGGPRFKKRSTSN